MQHIIKKQVIELALDKGLDAFSMQQRVSDFYFEKIVPMLQVAFDATSSEEETISIGNLEIDLGIINVKEIEKKNWDEKILKKIAEQLNPIKHGLPSPTKAQRKARPLSISEQWIFYMQHGYLPWNVLEVNEDWYRKTLEAFASDAVAISNLRHLINTDQGTVRRIVSQNTVSFLKSLIETLTAENQEALPILISELAEIISSDSKNRKQNASRQKNKAIQQLWMQVLQFAGSESKLKSGEFVRLLAGNNLSIRQLNSKRVKLFLLKNKIDTDFLKKIIKDKKHEESESIKKEIFVNEIKRTEEKNELKQDEIYVSNAGIVLLHPFLHPFFKNLHLVEGSDFINIQSQMKALYLLHYIATGNVNPEEHELVIAKVLCEFPLENPVDNLVELTEEELGEADSVLSSAIGQWEILKSTSADGLRESFLQRKGKLFTKNGGLILQAEQSSIDMLLDHLPWNLSVIKLPWMKDVLRVEWR